MRGVDARKLFDFSPGVLAAARDLAIPSEALLDILPDRKTEGKLQRADLRGANFGWRRDLAGENLSGLDLRGAQLHWADLSEASLVGTNLAGARLVCCNLDGANLTGANLSGAILGCSTIVGANLATADLRGANCYGADFGHVRALVTNLSCADCRGADFRSACLMSAVVPGADFTGALYDKTTTFPPLDNQIARVMREFPVLDPRPSGRSTAVEDLFARAGGAIELSYFQFCPVTASWLRDALQGRKTVTLEDIDLLFELLEKRDN